MGKNGVICSTDDFFMGSRKVSAAWSAVCCFLLFGEGGGGGGGGGVLPYDVLKVINDITKVINFG